MIEYRLQRCHGKALGLIAALPCVRGEHEDDFAHGVDFVKKTIHSNTVAPGFRTITFQFLDVAAEIWLPSELRIDIIMQLGDDLFPAGAEA